MKTIGMLGGMSWESSAAYYEIVNETVKAELGGLHSAQSLMYSFDFAEIEVLQERGDWEAASQMMVGAAQQLEQGGADFLIICTNTMHKLAGDVEAAVNIPLLHIADATAVAVKKAGLQRVGLLGTRFTMEQEFYRGRLEEKHGLDVLVPSGVQRQIVHDVIYNELCLGITAETSRERYRRIIAELAQRGAEGIIFGCTEIGLLVTQSDSPVPVFDTTRIHAQTAVAFALAT